MSDAKIEKKNEAPSKEIFRRFASRTAHLAGTSWAFGLAVTTIVVWGTTGPMFHFSDTWQLIINTGTTILTFLMVFLIQNTQNRDAYALHLKLDELIHATRLARNTLIAAETLSDGELDALHAEFLRARTRRERAVARASEAPPSGAISADELHAPVGTTDPEPAK